jgi:hypothetical protein
MVSTDAISPNICIRGWLIPQIQTHSKLHSQDICSKTLIHCGAEEVKCLGSKTEGIAAFRTPLHIPIPGVYCWFFCVPDNTRGTKDGGIFLSK